MKLDLDGNIVASYAMSDRILYISLLVSDTFIAIVCGNSQYPTSSYSSYKYTKIIDKELGF